ncbi:MAG: hypothetical protein ACRDN1_10895 [Trebonia sp.]
MLDELGVRRRVQIRVTGWLPLPFVVAGTDLVAIVPERLAHRWRSRRGCSWWSRRSAPWN